MSNTTPVDPHPEPDAEVEPAAPPSLTGTAYPEDPTAVPVTPFVPSSGPDLDPHDIQDGPDGTKLLIYRVGEVDHSAGVLTVIGLASRAGYDVIGAPDRLIDPTDGTSWRVQVATPVSPEGKDA